MAESASLAPSGLLGPLAFPSLQHDPKKSRASAVTQNQRDLDKQLNICRGCWSVPTSPTRHAGAGVEKRGRTPI